MTRAGLALSSGLGGARVYRALVKLMGAPVDDLARLIREMLLGLSSRETIEECMSFVIDDKGKPSAVEGQHDDRVLALAIAVQMAQRPAGDLLPEFNPERHTY